MHVLVLSGSRNREGQTARGIKSICKGLDTGGATSEFGKYNRKRRIIA